MISVDCIINALERCKVRLPFFYMHCITKLVDNQKIQTNDRQSLQELSFNVINCIAVLKQINHLADVNATENLHKIITRLPDHLIDKWKGVASDL